MMKDIQGNKWQKEEQKDSKYIWEAFVREKNMEKVV